MSSMSKSKQIEQMKKEKKALNKTMLNLTNERNNWQKDYTILEKKFKEFKKKNNSDWMRTHERGYKLADFFYRNKDKHKWCYDELDQTFNTGPNGFNYIACKKLGRENCENYKKS